MQAVKSGVGGERSAGCLPRPTRWSPAALRPCGHEGRVSVVIRRIVLLAVLGALALVTATPIESAPGGIPPKLAHQVRYLATHGGVLGTCHGCATPRMQALVRRLVVARFTPAGPDRVATALCVVRGESGFNPGAISRTGDFGVFQINKKTWYDTYDWPRILDPVYNVNVGWAMSKHGTYWYPWVVLTRGNCS